ncbi:MAG TPA: hypothetical protein VEA37_05275 [Flavobacterium sp.]|nr:hypothetical protein [Flavobacterium sp.]
MSETFKTILLKIGVIVVLAGVLFVVWQWRANNQSSAPQNEEQENGVIVNDGGNQPDDNVDAIIVDHTYKSGNHILSGNVMLPTPCHGLNAKAEVKPGLPEQVVLALEVTPPAEGTFCAQVIDERSFRVEFKGSPSPILSATLNGQVVPLVTNDLSGSLSPSIQ